MPGGRPSSDALARNRDLARRLDRARVGRERGLAEASRRLEEIGDLAVEAMDAGANVKEIAERAGITRPTLYRLLRERG